MASIALNYRLPILSLFLPLHCQIDVIYQKSTGHFRFEQSQPGRRTANLLGLDCVTQSHLRDSAQYRKFAWSNRPCGARRIQWTFSMMGLTRRQIVRAADDMYVGIIGWQLGRLFAWQDIKQRYRRSTLGPIWLTLSTGIQVLVMGIVSGFLFNTPMEKSLPYVCVGGLFWGLITNTINEGGTLFISTSSYITQIKICYTTFFIQIIFRNAIVFFHSFVIYILVALYFSIVPSIDIILWPAALLLNLICIESMVIIVSIISARYRDIPMIVQNVFTLLFWLTPIMYFPDQLGSHGKLVNFNPITHLIAIVRDPLLGGRPTLSDWLICICLAVVGWIVAFLFFARFRSRIVFWL